MIKYCLTKVNLGLVAASGIGFWVAECLFGVTAPSVCLRHISHQIKCMALHEFYILQIYNVSIEPGRSKYELSEVVNIEA